MFSSSRAGVQLTRTTSPATQFQWPVVIPSQCAMLHLVTLKEGLASNTPLVCILLMAIQVRGFRAPNTGPISYLSGIIHYTVTQPYLAMLIDL